MLNNHFFFSTMKKLEWINVHELGVPKHCYAFPLFIHAKHNKL